MNVDHGILKRHTSDMPDGYGGFGQMNILHLLTYSNVHDSIISVFLQHIREPSRLINKCDRYGRTPLHYDIMKCSGRSTKTLLDIGASVDILSKNEPVDLLAPTLVMGIRYLLSHTTASIVDEW